MVKRRIHLDEVVPINYVGGSDRDFIVTPNGVYSQNFPIINRTDASYLLQDKKIHPLIRSEKGWQQYWGNEGAASVSKTMDKTGRELIPYALSLANPLSFLAADVGGKSFDFATNELSDNKYKDWADMVHKRTGLNKNIAAISNPGYFIEGISRGLLKAPSTAKTIYNVGKKLDGNAVDRFVGDIVYRPIKTISAINDGRYIYDYKSLRRNVNRANKIINEGIDGSIKFHNNLTGRELAPNKYFKLTDKIDDGGLYYPMTDNIRIRLRDPYSNISGTADYFRFVGAHEQAHRIASYLSDNYGLPELEEYFENAYRPSTINAVSNKYYKLFSNAKRKHGRNPEETWANYVGSVVNHTPMSKFLKQNVVFEGVKVPRSFIYDYQSYLNRLKPDWQYVFE